MKPIPMNREDRSHLEAVLEQKGLGSILDIRKIEAGSSTENYQVVTNQGPVLARYYPFQPKDPGYEFRVLSILHENAVPVPEQFHFERTRDKTRPFVLMEFIEGEVLGDIFLTGQVPRDLMVKYVDELTKVHQINWRKLYKTVNLPDYAREPYAYAQRVLTNRVHDAEEFGLVDETRDVMEWMVAHSQVAIEDPLLLHGDYHPLNIVMRPTGEFVLLDWEGVDIGDYRNDLAFASIIMGVVGGETLEQEVIQLYRDQTGRKADDLEFYQVTNAFHRIVKFYHILKEVDDPLYYQLFNYLRSRVESITGTTFNFP